MSRGLQRAAQEFMSGLPQDERQTNRTAVVFDNTLAADMHAIEVQRNGAPVCVVGASNAIMFSVHVGLAIEGPAVATLDAMGMNDLGNGRQSHASWLEEAVLGTGDVVSLRFVDAPHASQPVKEAASDSEEHLEDQRWYDQQLRDNPFVPTEIPRNFANASLEVSLSGIPSIVATFEGGRQFITLHLHWDQWRPERCRVSLSSFSRQEALDRTGGKEWFSGALLHGEQCIAKVGG